MKRFSCNEFESFHLKQHAQCFWCVYFISLVTAQPTKTSPKLWQKTLPKGTNLVQSYKKRWCCLLCFDTICFVFVFLHLTLTLWLPSHNGLRWYFEILQVCKILCIFKYFPNIFPENFPPVTNLART